jgi:hypothetical protein
MKQAPVKWKMYMQFRWEKVMGRDLVYIEQLY